MFRRMARRQWRQAVMANQQLAVLNQANQLQRSGQFGQAAPLFQRLAQEMANLNHPRRAANLHAQAAHCYADSGNAVNALSQARTAMNLFIQYQMMERTPRFYSNITRKFQARGMDQAAASLQAEFGGAVDALPVAAQPVQPKPRGHLPNACPKCGAPVRSDDVDWIDDASAECPYCGTVLDVTL
jgi:hypothetical protein